MAVDVTDDSRQATSDRRARYGVLLLAIVAAFAVQGITNPGRLQQIVITALLASTLVLAFWVANARPWVLRSAVVVGAVVVAFSTVEALTGHVAGAPARIANLLLVTLAPGAVVIGVVRTLRARARVTLEAVLGVLCLYILIGMFFAFIYGTIDRLGHAFFAQDVQATVARCLYFSFTTMTTTGYGDLTAATNLGHTLSVSEALVGQIYLVTVVAVIVGNLSRPRRGPAGAQRSP